MDDQKAYEMADNFHERYTTTFTEIITEIIATHKKVCRVAEESTQECMKEFVPLLIIALEKAARSSRKEVYVRALAGEL